MGFASCLCYCGDVACWRPAKLCTMFGHLIGWYTISRFLVVLAPRRNFARCILHFTSKSCILLYWQCYCTALQQRAWAKLCSVVQGMELRNFCRGRHLYSAGRPSHWALAHILVLYYSLFLYVCFCCVRFSFFSTMPRDWLGRTSLKWPLCVAWDVNSQLNQSIVVVVVASE